MAAPQQWVTGSMPPELGSLIKLENLKLSDKELTGSLPTELGLLINLMSFWL
jgi:hypothetical protein